MIKPKLCVWLETRRGEQESTFCSGSLHTADHENDLLKLNLSPLCSQKLGYLSPCKHAETESRIISSDGCHGPPTSAYLMPWINRLFCQNSNSSAHNVMFCSLRITISLIKNSTKEMRERVRLHNMDIIVGSHAALK